MVGMGGRSSSCSVYHGFSQRLKVVYSVFHTCCHIISLQVWQEVEKLEFFVVFVPTVEMVFCFLDVGNPAVGVTVEVGAHVSKDNVWHMWLGVWPCGCDSTLVESPGKVTGNSLGPLRRVF